MDVRPEELRFLFTIRTPLAPNEIDFVYSCQAPADFEPRIADGEVETFEWVWFERFKEIAKNPDEHKMVSQGREYFALLIGEFERG